MPLDLKHLPAEQLLQFYKDLLLPRLIEEKMLVLLRQGKISKWFSGIGQEAIAVGATLALQPDEWIMPLHRNLGVFTTRRMPLHQLFLQWQGSQQGYSKGRERSFHFGSAAHYICGMISHLGPQLAVADGVALANQLRHDKKVALAFTGDGGTSEGDFHEALNLAAVWDLPVIFLVENNGYGLSTPVSEQYRCSSLVEKAKGYGMEGVQIDGNNLLTVYDTIRGVRDYCIRHQKPYLVECMTFRMRGHEEASGTKYVPKELFAKWELKDPIKNFELDLILAQVLTAEEADQIKENIREHIENELAMAKDDWPLRVDTDTELADVYAQPQTAPLLATEDTSTELRFIDAIKQGLWQAMEQDPRLVLMGQDIAEYGGAFKITEGFLERFGKARVRNTPLCESAVIGAALGLSLEGYHSMVEMQFADFISSGFNQVVNNLAKIHYRWGQSAHTVIRMPTGGGMGAGPFHSQSNEAWFVHTPGLKVVYPSTPEDAKGLLLAALNDPNPVLFFEHKGLYRSISAQVLNSPYETPIGKARTVQHGDDISVITYGMGVHWALEYVKAHPETSIELLDLRTLQPLDYDAIKKCVQQTGRVLVLHEDTLTGGIGAEVVAWITEHCFQWLDAPVIRCASLDTPIPFNTELEKNFMAASRLPAAVERLLNY